MFNPTLTISPRENQLDQEQYAKIKTAYQQITEQVLREQKPELCQALPDIFLPYRRGTNDDVQYISSQKDGPNVPDRFNYWPQKQCLFAYASNVDRKSCSRLFTIPEEREDCDAATIQKHTRFETLDNLPSEVHSLLGKKWFYSTSSGKSLPYFIFFPTAEVKGILIYLHGAGGGLEQGTLDGTYKDSFKRLKQILKTDLSYLYVTPSLSDFGAGGGQDANDLAKELTQRYPNVPIYLAGSSAGGRTTFYALKDPHTVFKGALALCPAIDHSLTRHSWDTGPTLPLWIIQGEQDQLVPVHIVDTFVDRLQQQGRSLTYQRIQGDHGAPIDQVDWKRVLQAFAQPTSQ